MSRHTSFQFRGEREGRVAQMSRQEEVIARKRQELLERQKESELAKQVAAAQSGTAAAASTPATTTTTQEVPTAAKEVKHPLNLPKQTFETDPPKPSNTFTNDGSFFENFRKITEAAKKAEEEKQKKEAELRAKQEELQKAQSGEIEPPQLIPPMDSAFSTNSMGMPMGPPHMPDPSLLHQNIPSFLNLAAPPPPPPPNPPANEPDFTPAPVFNATPMQPPTQAPPPPPPQQFPGPNIQQTPPFEGNNYLNENQMNRNYGNIDQMERNVANKNHQMNSVQQLNSDMSTASNITALKSSIPTTIDGLIEYIAQNGDDFEEKIVAEITQMNERTLFRFLNDKGSENYKIYREKVLNYRAQKMGQPIPKDSGDKYDPGDILRDDDDDLDNVIVHQPTPATSDEYDSDSEYMQETMERNKTNIMENMKRRIDNEGTNKRCAQTSHYSSDDDDRTDEEDHMEMWRKIQMRENAELEDEIEQSRKQQQQRFQQQQQNQQPPQRQQLLHPQHQQQQQKPPSLLDIQTQNPFGKKPNNSKNRKKRSRWGDNPPMQQQLPNQQIPAASSSTIMFGGKRPTPMLSTITRTDPALLNYARQNYGTTDLTEEDWSKCEEHFKVNLLYQDMIRKRDELDRLAKSGQHKYEYDSDEDVTGGTWEHKMRTDEMEATAAWADALTKQESIISAIFCLQRSSKNSWKFTDQNKQIESRISLTTKSIN